MTPLDAVLDPLAYAFFVRALIAAAIVGLVCAVGSCVLSHLYCPSTLVLVVRVIF